MTDIVLCTLPRMSLFYPPLAPALLKASVEKAGYKAKVLDFLIKFYQTFHNKEHWEEIDAWLVIPSRKDSKILNIVQQELHKWAVEILSYNPRWIGISVFSYESHKIAALLVYELRKLDFNVKIVLGGMGITGDANNYGQDLLETRMINAILQGDGEHSLVELLGGGNKTGKYLVSNLDEIAVPNFEDYDLDQYKIFKNKKAGLGLQEKELVDKSKMYQGFGNTWYRNDSILTLPITGSKGCVRKCTFCDVPSHWPKYITRTADSMFQEIVSQHRKYQPQRFHFTDSLINGNMKIFRELCTKLAQWREENTEVTFTFTGQYICRNWKSETDSDYETMRKAGIRLLEVGIETGSEKVRFHMGKKFTNEDVFMLLERCKRNDIKVLLLMIVGYPYEELEDHHATMTFLKECTRYKDNIEAVILGKTLTVDEDASISKDPNISFITFDNGKTDPLLWVNSQNKNLTLYERLCRRIELTSFSNELGLSTPTNMQDMLYLHEKWLELGKYEGTDAFNDPFKDIF